MTVDDRSQGMRDPAGADAASFDHSTPDGAACAALRIPATAELRVDAADALWLFSSFCTLHQKAFDAELVARECLPPLFAAELGRIASRLDKSRRRDD